MLTPAPHELGQSSQAGAHEHQRGWLGNLPLRRLLPETGRGAANLGVALGRRGPLIVTTHRDSDDDVGRQATQFVAAVLVAEDDLFRTVAFDDGHRHVHEWRFVDPTPAIAI